MYRDLNLLNGIRERNPLTSGLETKHHLDVQQYNYSVKAIIPFLLAYESTSEIRGSVCTS